MSGFLMQKEELLTRGERTLTRKDRREAHLSLIGKKSFLWKRLERKYTRVIGNRGWHTKSGKGENSPKIPL